MAVVTRCTSRKTFELIGRENDNHGVGLSGASSVWFGISR
jgi:hypothetical protein